MKISLHHIDATKVPMGSPVPKPTSVTGQHEATARLNRGGDLQVGVWTCDPGEFSADRTQATEICQILSGSATVAGEDGTKVDVTAGSLLVLPMGWRGTWTVHEAIRKSYVIVATPVGFENID